MKPKEGDFFDFCYMFYSRLRLVKHNVSAAEGQRQEVAV